MLMGYDVYATIADENGIGFTAVDTNDLGFVRRIHSSDSA